MTSLGQLHHNIIGNLKFKSVCYQCRVLVYTVVSNTTVVYHFVRTWETVDHFLVWNVIGIFLCSGNSCESIDQMYAEWFKYQFLSVYNDKIHFKCFIPMVIYVKKKCLHLKGDCNFCMHSTRSKLQSKSLKVQLHILVLLQTF